MMGVELPVELVEAVGLSVERVAELVEAGGLTVVQMAALAPKVLAPSVELKSHLLCSSHNNNHPLSFSSPISSSISIPSISSPKIYEAIIPSGSQQAQRQQQQRSSSSSTQHEQQPPVLKAASGSTSRRG